jgi:hypothetical protein
MVGPSNRETFHVGRDLPLAITFLKPTEPAAIQLFIREAFSIVRRFPRYSGIYYAKYTVRLRCHGLTTGMVGCTPTCTWTASCAYNAPRLGQSAQYRTTLVCPHAPTVNRETQLGLFHVYGKARVGVVPGRRHRGAAAAVRVVPGHRHRAATVIH